MNAEEVARALQRRFGVSAPDVGLLREALIHSSYANEHPDAAPRSNERLEFLGDAVLNLIVAERAYLDSPGADEGDLSTRRAMLVRQETLARAAESIGLGNALLLGRGEEMGGGRSKDSVLASALEAVVAAVYLANEYPPPEKLGEGGDEGQRPDEPGKAAAGDAAGSAGRGLYMARKLVLGLLAGEIEALGRRDPATLPGEYDPKTSLAIEIRARGLPQARYVVIAEEGPDHDKRFKVAVFCDDRVLGYGCGKNKRQAEQEAAKEALKQLILKETPGPPSNS